ncbi:MAG: sulfatase-like hydrolase/transferase [Pirellulales bacterium]
MRFHPIRRGLQLLIAVAALVTAVESLHAADSKKPNVLIIWGDDIGWNNPSCYNRGVMGYKTPNIDRLAKQDALFTDWYGQQSCTAGRAAFIAGQSLLRTGLLKVGLPGAKEGISIKDPTIAGLLKSAGIHDRPIR